MKIKDEFILEIEHNKHHSTHYNQNMENYKTTAVGHQADKMKMCVSFTEKDIPDLIEFLINCTPCFEK